jgi:hypothetical protein
LEQRVKKLLMIVKLMIEQAVSLRVLDELELFLEIFEEEIVHFDEKTQSSNHVDLTKAINDKRLHLNAKHDIACKMDRCDVDFSQTE